MNWRNCGAVLLVAGIFVIICIAIEKEAYSVTKREALIEQHIDEVSTGTKSICEALRDTLHIDDVKVVWRGCAIASFLVALVSSSLICLIPCPPPLAVFIIMFFVCLSVFYLKAGCDHCHGTGYVQTAIHSAARAMCEKEHPSAAFKRRLL